MMEPAGRLHKLGWQTTALAKDVTPDEGELVRSCAVCTAVARCTVARPCAQQ